MKILLTGSTGVLGQALLSHWKGPEFFCFRDDISQFAKIKRFYDDTGPFDAVIHLAALVPVDKVKADPLRAFEVNTLGTSNLLEVVRTSGDSPWIFYCSSSHIYETSKTPIL